MLSSVRCIDGMYTVVGLLDSVMYHSLQKSS